MSANRSIICTASRLVDTVSLKSAVLTGGTTYTRGAGDAGNSIA